MENGVYYFSPDNTIYGLDAATGDVVWSYPADSIIFGAPVVAEGLVYVTSQNGVFYALDAASGAHVWDRLPEDSTLLSPTVVNGILLAESDDGNLQALVAATGEEVWSFQKGYLDGVPAYAVADGVLYVGTLYGGIHAFAVPQAG